MRVDDAVDLRREVAGIGIARRRVACGAVMHNTAALLGADNSQRGGSGMGAAFGAALAFFAGRHLVRQFVETYVSRHPRLAAIDRAVEGEGARLVFLLRLSPLVPYVLLNYVLGVSRIGFRDYMVGWAGQVPLIAGYVYAGKAAGDLATLASGVGTTRGATYYWMLGLGLVSTALATALDMGFMSEMLSIFSVVVGIALLLTGIGLVILAYAVFGRVWPAAQAAAPATAPGPAAA